METNSLIYVAGHNGMVGSAVVRLLRQIGYTNILTVPRHHLDLCDHQAVIDWFERHKPEYVVFAAAKVGGIEVNRRFPVEFLRDNLMMQNNVIQASFNCGVKQFVFLGSSCAYPKDSPQPIREEYLMTGPLEPTNEGYALAKIAGIKLAQFYHLEYGFDVVNPMPCNLYGTNDNFSLTESHVLAALVRKFVDAALEDKREVILWGSGVARREFLHVDDLARALLFLLEHYHKANIINVGSGTDITINDLAHLIAQKACYRGEIHWDTSKPDGMLRKCLDISKITELGFVPLIGLELGIDKTIAEYKRLKGEGVI